MIMSLTHAESTSCSSHLWVSPLFTCAYCVWNYACFLLSLQVRKEYGKCLRTHCCSGKSVETSISSSSKTTTSRTPGRYSTGSQVSLPACTPGRYSTADSQVRPVHTNRVVIMKHFQLQYHHRQCYGSCKRFVMGYYMLLACIRSFNMNVLTPYELPF